MKANYKKIKKILAFTLLGLTLSDAFAQAPQKMSYQSVVRNSSNALVSNANVGIRVSILQGSSSGSAVYVETHATQTNANGLASIQIGGGTVVSGAMTTIDWGNGSYFVKTETDPTGGSNYSITGTQQLLSVPYALYADSSGTPGPAGPQGPIGPAGAQGPAGPQGPGFTHYVGELFGGGIIFDVYKDASGAEHGLIATLTDISSGSSWWTVNSDYTTPAGISFWDGEANTNAIVTAGGGGTSAASLCANSTIGGQTDWYLPSADQLLLLRNVKYNINKVLSTTPGASRILDTSDYWSSTETDVVGTINQAYWVSMRMGEFGRWSKNDSYPIRAVRNF